MKKYIFQDGGEDPTGADFFNNLLDMGGQQSEDNVEQSDNEPTLNNDFIDGLSDYAKESDNTDLQSQIEELRQQLKLQKTESYLDNTQQDLEEQLLLTQYYQTPEGEDALLSKYETKPPAQSYTSQTPKYTPVEAGTNNVGNIRDVNTGDFKNFDTPEQGEQALLNQLNLYQTGKTHNKEKGTGKRINGTTTLLDAMKVYAPSSDNNNPTAYAKFIAKRLGVDVNARIGDINTQAWANAIKVMEGNTKTTKKKQIGGFASTFQGGRLGMTTVKNKRKYSC